MARRVGPGLGSLGIAIVLWLLVRNLDRSPARFTVPVSYEYPEQVLVLADRVAEVEVSVRATKPKLRTLQAAEFVVKVRNRDGRPGREFIVLDADDVEAPFGVEVERVTPAQFVVRFEERLVRLATIRPDIQGKPAPGHEVVLGEVRIRPGEVPVAGPISQFEEPLTVTTDRIDVTGRSQDLRARSVGLVRPGQAFSFDGPTTVEVDIPIRPIVTRRSFDDIPVQVIEGDRAVSAPNPRRLRLTVEGPQAQVDALTASALSVIVDAAALTPRRDDYQVEPRIEIAEGACPGCRVVGKSQAKVNVTVREPRKSRR